VLSLLEVVPSRSGCVATLSTTSVWVEEPLLSEDGKIVL
jgi:hypothetical protein